MILWCEIQGKGKEIDALWLSILPLPLLILSFFLFLVLEQIRKREAIMMINYSSMTLFSFMNRICGREGEGEGEGEGVKGRKE